MTTDQLRAAAEGIVKAFEAVAVDDPLRQAILAVAQAWLVEHPADDGEPITEEWLRSVGFCEPTMNGWHFLVNADDGDPMELWIDFEGYASLVQSNENDLVAITSNRYQTRGDLRLLARALGIPLKERTDVLTSELGP